MEDPHENPVIDSISSNDEDDDGQRSSNSRFLCGVVEGFYGRPWTTEQRKELFRMSKTYGLNTYMYAPKDDFKHRAYWRELYSVEEADQLSGLISAAKENGITFYYAISPGLDIVYSSSKEVTCLKRKLEQVSQFGCEAFAILFDDIEPEIGQADKEVFQSFAQAQVSVANEIYQCLNQPAFVFCPTEYCSARANPNVRNSEYLNTIGCKLLPGIDIMWTGTKVITKTITVESIRELTEVLRRPPVIWDNLHANDYDQKRIFLGPYSGRSTDLVSHLRGVFTNPNCEYEANFIPIHTIAQWSKCNSDAKCMSSEVSANIRLETESESGSEDIPSHLSPTTYHPKKALKIAIKDWLPEFYKNKSAHGKVVAPLASAVANLSVPPPAMVEAEEKAVAGGEDATSPLNGGSSFVPITKELVNSLVDPPVILNPILEPMDCNPPSAPGSPKASDAQMSSQVTSLSSSSDRASPSLEEMQTDPSEVEENRLTFDDVSLLVDLFYLPFEHGLQGMQMLNEFQWLKCNSHLISSSCKLLCNRNNRKSCPSHNKVNNSSRANSNSNRKQSSNERITEDDFDECEQQQNGGDVLTCTPEVIEWKERARKFDEMSMAVNRLFNKMAFIKNRTLLYDFYPYVWDIKGVVSLLNSYVKWLENGKAPSQPNGFVPPAFSWFSKGYKEAFTGGDQEPWLFRGGLTGELQRLLPIDSVSDLFLYKAPESPSSHIFTIRPYTVPDEALVYDVSYKAADPTAMDVDQEFRELFASDKIGGFLTLSPEFCFVVEDEQSICGYALAAVDAVQFSKKIELAWMPDLRRKYPFNSSTQTNGNCDPMSSRKQAILQSIHSSQLPVPDFVAKNHPSVLKLELLPHVQSMDSSVSKRMLACVLTALKANGSSGVHCRIEDGERDLIDFFSKLGFSEITDDGSTQDGASTSSDTSSPDSKRVVFMGRAV